MTRIGGQPASDAAQAAKLRGILDSALSAIITINEVALIESVNPATERLFGYSAHELVGQNVRLLMPVPYRTEHDTYVASYLATGTKKIIGIGRDVVGQRKDGRQFAVHLSVGEFQVDGRRYFTGIIQDLSERTRIEDALRESEKRLTHAQKMEAIGQLTGGIAHDFNNLLLVAIGNLELLEPRLVTDEKRELLREAQEALLLGSKLTGQLLSFSRKAPMDARIVRLNELVVGITELLRRTLGEHISLSTALASDLWPVRTDGTQIQSAIINLASMQGMRCQTAVCSSSKHAKSCSIPIIRTSMRS